MERSEAKIGTTKSRRLEFPLHPIGQILHVWKVVKMVESVASHLTRQATGSRFVNLVDLVSNSLKWLPVPSKQNNFYHKYVFRLKYNER